MVEETVTCIEQMEKNQLDLHEILARDCEEHREQMAQMMKVIIRMARRKRTVDDTGSMNIVARTQGITEDLVITVFRSTWNDKNQCNGVATNLFLYRCDWTPKRFIFL